MREATALPIESRKANDQPKEKEKERGDSEGREVTSSVQSIGKALDFVDDLSLSRADFIVATPPIAAKVRVISF